MVRQINGITGRRGRGGYRGGFGGRGRGGRGAGFPGGRGGIQKPPPLMARPMPPPNNMRPDPHRPMGPSLRPMPSMPMMNEIRRMGPPRMPHPSGVRGRGEPNMRMGLRGRGVRPPLRGMLPTLRSGGPSGLLPPPPPVPRPIPGPPGPIFRHRPPMHPGMMGPMGIRGRGIPGRVMRGGPRGRGMHMVRGSANGRKSGKPNRGRGGKPKNANSPSREINKPWVTEAMKNEILKKHKLHQKAKKARTKEDGNELWEAFKEHRNKVTTMLREAKLEYIGAHPEEDVDKILAEATTHVSDKDETKQSTSVTEVNDATPKVAEGAEPMEEGGSANEADTPQDPEVEMKQESVSQTEKNESKADSETEPNSDHTTTESGLKANSEIEPEPESNTELESSTQ